MRHVDYLTLTMARTEDGYNAALECVLQLFRFFLELGYEEKEVGSKGGFKGQRCGPYAAMVSEWGMMVVISGKHTPMVGAALCHYDFNGARVDAQLTIDTSGFGGTGKVMDGDWRDCCSKNRELTRQRKITRTMGSSNGYTIYIGSRSSETFCRIYDKEAESGDSQFKNCVRYEVEFKDARARSVWAQIRDLQLCRPEVVDCSVAHLVDSTFANRGVTVPIHFPDGEQVPLIDSAISRDVTDVARKLDWLRFSVRPTVQYLVKTGRLEGVLIALGLDVEPSLDTEQDGIDTPLT